MSRASKALYIVAAVMLAASLASCKKEKKTEDIIVEKVVEKPQGGPQRMDSDERSGSVTWIGGAEYSYTITRQPKDSLDIVENNGRKYFDNSISLTVSRADGSVFFHKTFTKANFAPALPAQFRDTGVLLGMNLEKAQGNTLRFVVSVGSPDENDEEFYYVLMTLDNYGSTRADGFKAEEKG